MLLSGLKRYVFHTQMRHFASFPTHTRTKVRKEAMNQWTELKYSHPSNPRLGVYRLFSTDSEKNANEVYLSSLIRIFPSDPPPFPFFNIFATYCLVRATIDKEFRLFDFIGGSKQAILVISRALAAQDYEALDGMVRDRTIKLLKGRVDSLNDFQRQLIAINPETFYYFPGRANIRKIKDNEVILQVDMYGLYLKLNERQFRLENVLFCIYRFQRKYKDGIGGEWIVHLLNHIQRDDRSP